MQKNVDQSPRKKKISRLSLLSALICSSMLYLSACGDADRFYELNHDLPKGQWQEDSLLTFEVDIQDTAQAFDIYYNIRNGIDYNFSNLYVKIYFEDDKGKTLGKQLQDITLFDSKTGRPYGSGQGDLFDHSLPALQHFKFRNKGKNVVKIQQYMRKSPLKGIFTFGIRLEKSTSPMHAKNK